MVLLLLQFQIQLFLELMRWTLVLRVEVTLLLLLFPTMLVSVLVFTSCRLLLEFPQLMSQASILQVLCSQFLISQLLLPFSQFQKKKKYISQNKKKLQLSIKTLHGSVSYMCQVYINIYSLRALMIIHASYLYINKQYIDLYTIKQVKVYRPIYNL